MGRGHPIRFHMDSGPAKDFDTETIPAILDAIVDLAKAIREQTAALGANTAAIRDTQTAAINNQAAALLAAFGVAPDDRPDLLSRWTQWIEVCRNKTRV